MATGQLAEFRSQPLRLRGKPVFVYHGLTSRQIGEISVRERKYWVLAAQFREQLSYLQRAGYQIALLRELWSLMEGSDLGIPAVALTFDDGRQSDYEIAYPLLLQCGSRADFFVNTAAVGTPGFLSWQQIAEMQRAGMSFQSHSHDHVDLLRLPWRRLQRQLKDSKQMLEDRLGSSVDFLAVPYGLLNDHVVELALQVGYHAVCDSRSWPARPGAQTVNRVAVYRHTTLRDFQRLAAGSLVSYGARAARMALLYLPKRILLHFWQPGLSTTVSEDPA